MIFPTLGKSLVYGIKIPSYFSTLVIDVPIPGKIDILSETLPAEGSYTEPYKISEKDGQCVVRPKRLSPAMGYAINCLTISKGLYCKTNEVGSYTEPDNP